MKKVTPAFLATICEGTSFEAVQNWVTKFNTGMNTEVPSAAVVIEMNKRGAKIPIQFIHNDLIAMSTLSPGEVDGNNIKLSVTTQMDIIVPLNEELDLQNITERIHAANINCAALLEKKQSTKKTKKTTSSYRVWTSDEDKLVMSHELPMGELIEAIDRTAPAIYSRRTTLRRKKLNT